MPSPLSSRLPLSRQAVDRDYLTRDRVDVVPELLADPSTRVLPLWRGRTLMAGSDRLALLPASAVPAARDHVYLGRSQAADAAEPVGTPIVAALLDDEQATALEPSDDAWGSLRMFGTTLSDRDAGLAVEAIAVANWHDSHRFSPRTGRPLVTDKAGWVRRDADDGHEVFPRTDPAIIVGVVDADDRLLLGSNALWENNRYSLLAGFVEPGESLEQAVQREIFEESGIKVVDPVYLGSQPWPFPASLMLGFRATVDVDDPGTLEPDGAEILDLRWFSRDELAASLDDVILPGRTSIARAIIEDWFGAPLDQ
ncbi:NAD(+) diphosphatase [Frigoribacterium sp. 2-23]|uniref:NAD(+) diphosphatase n=1 Tax=Frigoribacterium sp. 2-23 TaxID=3415006 RepID=UPI003C6ED78F